MKGKNEVFVDQRHTPEVVVAISDLSWGFVGFSPISAIMSFLSRIPELRDANGSEAVTVPMFSSLETSQGSESL